MKPMNKLTDESLMPFGKYQGKKLANVPADYLLWLHKANVSGQLGQYIKENLDAIEEEIRQKGD
jgi:uncharacterized protein (DUF3820 family)